MSVINHFQFFTLLPNAPLSVYMLLRTSMVALQQNAANETSAVSQNYQNLSQKTLKAFKTLQNTLITPVNAIATAYNKVTET